MIHNPIRKVSELSHKEGILNTKSIRKRKSKSPLHSLSLQEEGPHGMAKTFNFKVRKYNFYFKQI